MSKDHCFKIICQDYLWRFETVKFVFLIFRTNPLYSGDDLTKFDRNIFHKYFPKDSSRSAGSSSSGYSSQKQEQDEHEVDEQQQSSGKEAKKLISIMNTSPKNSITKTTKILWSFA